MVKGVGSVLVVAGLLLLQGCAAQRIDGPTALINLQDKCGGDSVAIVQIRFDALDRIGLCPTAVTTPAGNSCEEGAEPILRRVSAERSDDDVVCARRGQLVRWVAIDADGSPLGIKYDIYFDPFVGRTLHSNDKGCAKAVVNANAPRVAYKYSVVRQKEGCPPFDPKFVVQP